MKELSYWERLMKLELYSQHRRRDRHSVIYTWTILENLVPNPNPTHIFPTYSISTRCKCAWRSLPTQAPERLRTLLSTSFTHNGPKTFNALRRSIRDTTHYLALKFKTALDRCLETLPDEHSVHFCSAC